MEQIRNFDQLLQAALAHGRKGIAVAAPYDKNPSHGKQVRSQDAQLQGTR